MCRFEKQKKADVAARGHDIPDVAHVIDFGLPNDIDDYMFIALGEAVELGILVWQPATAFCY